jgi:hypothetical protein
LPAQLVRIDTFCAMRSGDIQQRLIRRYEQLLRAEVANARRRPGRGRGPVAAELTPDVATTIAAARKAAGKPAERRLA